MATPDPSPLDIQETSNLNRRDSNRVFQDQFPETRFISPVLINWCQIADALIEPVFGDFKKIMVQRFAADDRQVSVNCFFA